MQRYIRVDRMGTLVLPNPHPNGVITWQEFHTIRNELVDVCKNFGRVGPIGKCNIRHDANRLHIDDCTPGDNDPQYYIIEDQYNNDCYQYVELYGHDLFSIRWLLAIQEMLSHRTNWGVGISNLPGAYVLIRHNIILAKGIRRYGRCSIDDFVSEVSDLATAKRSWLMRVFG